jgi:hypothetical protein
VLWEKAPIKYLRKQQQTFELVGPGNFSGVSWVFETPGVVCYVSQVLWEFLDTGSF